MDVSAAAIAARSRRRLSSAPPSTAQRSSSIRARGTGGLLLFASASSVGSNGAAKLAGSPLRKTVSFVAALPLLPQGEGGACLPQKHPTLSVTYCRRAAARHLRQYAHGGRQGRPRQGAPGQRALLGDGQPLPVRGRVLQPGVRLGERADREERPGCSPSALAADAQLPLAGGAKRLAGDALPGALGASRRSSIIASASGSFPPRTRQRTRTRKASRQTWPDNGVATPSSVESGTSHTSTPPKSAALSV